MSWPQWSSTQPPVPQVLNTAPVINSAPAVVPPGLQYTQDQWAQLQQQNWHQWAQWQQQYQQWHQQYGAEYQKSMNAIAQAAQAQQVAGLPNVAVPPPLPTEAINPPLPSEDPPPPLPSAPSYTTVPPPNANQGYTTAPPLPKTNERPPPTQYLPKNNQNWPSQNNFRPVSSYQHNKRSFDQGPEGEPKRQMLNKPGWQNQPPPQTRPPPKENIEELSEAEKKFDKQFAEWEAQFQKWKEQNVEHPDKEQYREYEKKWESWRAQLLERREQMKRKRLGLTGSSPSLNRTGPNTSFNSPQQNFNQPPPPKVQMNQPPPKVQMNQPPPKVQMNQPPPTVQTNLPPPKTGGLLPVPGGGATLPLNKPPPTLNDEPLTFKDSKPLLPEPEEIVDDFIKPNTGGGIPGLDLVKDDPKPDKEGGDDVVVLDSEEKEREKKGPDFDAISKGINSILGDPKLLNMLSMVSQTQPKINDNLTNTTSNIKDGNTNSGPPLPYPEQSNQSFEEHSNHSETYGQREFVHNFDDQTRSSFTMAHNEQEVRFDGSGNCGRNQKFEPNKFGQINNFNERFPPRNDRFPPQDRFGPNHDKFGANQDRFGSNLERFGPNQDKFGPGQDKFGPNQDRFGPNQDRFGPGQDKFGPNQDRFGSGQDKFGPNQDRFGPGQDKFGPNQDRFGPVQDKFGLNQDRFGPGQDKFGPNQDKFGPGQDKFGLNLNRFGPGQDKFGPSQDRFGSGQDKFGLKQDMFGPGQDKFGLTQDKFGSSQDKLGPNQDRFGSGQDKFGPSLDRFGVGQDKFGSNQDRFGPNQDRFGPNQDKFGPNQNRFGSNQDKFGSNQDRFGPNQDKFGPGQDRMRPNQNRLDEDRFGSNQNRFGLQDKFGSGPDRYGSNQNKFGLGPGPDKFGPNQDKFGSAPNRFGANQDRFGPNQDKFGSGPDRFGSNQDKFASGPDRFGPNQDKFGSGPDRFLSNQDKFGQNPGRFGPNQDKFGSGSDRFGLKQDKFGPNQDRFGPNQDRFGSTQDKFGLGRNDFGSRGGPSSSNYGGNFRSYDEMNPEENYDDGYDYDQIAAKFEEPEPPVGGNVDQGWEEPNYDEDNFNEPPVVPEPLSAEVPPDPTELFQPTTVIDYDHKPPKPAEPEVLIEPIFMFDYRHKALSRIPLPQRPKWLSDAVKGIREFDPPLVRPYEPPNLRRYPPPVENWRKNDRYQDDWSPPTRRSFNENRPPFEERRSYYDDRPYDQKGGRFERKKEEKKTYNEDKGSYPDEKRIFAAVEYEGEKISDTEWPEDDDEIETSKKDFLKFPPKKEDKPGTNKNIVSIEDLINPPGRFKRPPRLVIILRGPPGSGKTFLAKLIKDKEVENGGSTPRILSLDDYFMVEQEKEVTEEGKKVKIKDMVYEYEAEMEESYRTSLIKSFKKTITDGYFSFIIVDNVNDKVKYFGEMWSFAKQNGFQVYICQLDLDVQTCSKRNVHGRSEAEIEKCVAGWEPTPSHHPVLDATSLLQSASIPEVEMEEVNSPESDMNENDGSEDQVARSKWDNFDLSVDNLAKLDGLSKPLRQRTMEEYLRLDTEWTPVKFTKPGQKRVRWADLEERKEQEKMRAIGFVVGQTDWERMMDPTGGTSALTQTKYIEKTGRYKVEQK